MRLTTITCEHSLSAGFSVPQTAHHNDGEAVLLAVFRSERKGKNSITFAVPAKNRDRSSNNELLCQIDRELQNKSLHSSKVTSFSGCCALSILPR